MKSPGTTKVHKVSSMGNMNVSTEHRGNPLSGCQDISVWTQVVDRPTAMLSFLKCTYQLISHWWLAWATFSAVREQLKMFNISPTVTAMITKLKKSNLSVLFVPVPLIFPQVCLAPADAGFIFSLTSSSRASSFPGVLHISSGFNWGCVLSADVPSAHQREVVSFIFSLPS